MRLSVKLGLLLLVLTGTSCGSILGSKAYCDIAEPIGVSENDLDVISDPLVEDLLVHNQVYEKLCQ
tara:strand:- start:509 stop:706 length:198 start_codon:yes stop_codon:yes gene_type:complete